METAIRPATPADLDAVVAVLTDAFGDDPVMSWAFPDEPVRRRRVRALWTFLAGRLYLPDGSSTIEPGGGAVALWQAPGQTARDGFWEENGAEFVVALEGEVGRLSALGELMAVHRPTEPHWYLPAIGVSPVQQGRKLGSALLAHTLARADAAGAPAYLEATSPRSRALYERHGFDVTADLAASALSLIHI